ncbi:hypothetical protein [Psychrobacter sp. 16-MNA-CIBAN-0192]|uniref:hypothetical protein n=1 Tax=Psychrobacter sp. 16-MNA-CIBAN-0192 TaxID=3140448 RepID=UPI00331822FD
MLKRKLSIIGVMVLIVAMIGCSHAVSNRDDSVENNALSPAVQKTAEDIILRGDFKRSFEIHELEANGTLYYVSDPKQLLMAASEKMGQRHYSKSFTTCVVGMVGSEGGYGPTSKYQNQITVHDLCV